MSADRPDPIFRARAHGMPAIDPGSLNFMNQRAAMTAAGELLMLKDKMLAGKVRVPEWLAHVQAAIDELEWLIVSLREKI
jgi:hypothetical protein